MPRITLRTGSFPHQAYVARCGCVNGREDTTTNYAGHVVGPPRCSTCGRSYELDEQLMQPQFNRKDKDQ